MLFYAFYSVDLASHSVALTTYETSCINWFHLASYVRLDCVATQVLDVFHIPPRQTLHFYKIVGVEPTAYSLKGNHSTIELYQPTVMCCLSCFIIFWTTKYNTPRTFCLADYSVVFCDQCLCITTYPSTTKTAYELLVATPRINTLPFLIPVDKLVLCWGQHHLLLSVRLSYPHGNINRHSFQHTCFTVTTTGLISDRTLTGVSRLA